MGALYYDRNGRCIDCRAWEYLSARPEYGHVAYDEIASDGDRLVVITSWLGVVSDPRLQPPLIYRTIAGTYRHGRLNTAHQWGWPSRPAAIAGHHGVLAWMTGAVPAPPATPLR